MCIVGLVLVHRGSTDDLLLLQISSGVDTSLEDQGTRSVLHTLYLLSPRLCFSIVLKCDLIVNRDDSLTSKRVIMNTTN